jgi:hypothetical protein
MSKRVLFTMQEIKSTLSSAYLYWQVRMGWSWQSASPLTVIHRIQPEITAIQGFEKLEMSNFFSEKIQVSKEKPD